MEVDLNSDDAKILALRIAAARAQQALVHVEAAQRELDRASQNLSSIIGASRDCDTIMQLHARVNRLWHRLHDRLAKNRGRWKLDGVALRAELQWFAQRAGGAT
jgi:hypothetical protein